MPLRFPAPNGTAAFVTGGGAYCQSLSFRQPKECIYHYVLQKYKATMSILYVRKSVWIWPISNSVAFVSSFFPVCPIFSSHFPKEKGSMRDL